MSDEGIKVVARNRKAQHEYFLEDRYEAGVVLKGTEIKSVRAGQVSLQEAYVAIERGEAWLHAAHIAPYDPASEMNHDPVRSRKLLLHRRELDRLARNVQQKGYTIVPTRMYLAHGLAKVEIALAKGKRQYDKRRKIKERDAQRQVDRALSRRRSG
jgi:SsrA-binding protein